jgi:hypothetical protein
MIIVLSIVVACFIAYTILLLLAILERDRLIKILRSQLQDADARLDNANAEARKEMQIAQKLRCQLDQELVWHAEALKIMTPKREKNGRFAKRSSE